MMHPYRALRSAAACVLLSGPDVQTPSALHRVPPGQVIILDLGGGQLVGRFWLETGTMHSHEMAAFVSA